MISPLTSWYLQMRPRSVCERQDLCRTGFRRYASLLGWRVLCPECERELRRLTADGCELLDDLRIGAGIDGFKACLERIDARAERRWPAAQCMNDRAQRCEYRTGSLPPVCRHDAADRAAVQVRTIVGTQFFQRVECVLDKAGDAAVIARRRDDDRVRVANRFDQLKLFVGALRIFRRVMRQAVQKGAPKQMGARTGAFGAAQRETERTFGRRRRARRATDSHDEWPAMMIETCQENAPSTVAVRPTRRGCA